MYEDKSEDKEIGRLQKNAPFSISKEIRKTIMRCERLEKLFY
jgi:hypothetical protein